MSAVWNNGGASPPSQVEAHAVPQDGPSSSAPRHVAEVERPAKLSGLVYARPQATPAALAALAELAELAERAHSAGLALSVPPRPRLATLSAPAVAAQAPTPRLLLPELVDRVIVPALMARHARPVVVPIGGPGMATVLVPVVPMLAPVEIDPHAAELAHLLLVAEPRAAFELIDALRADGRSMAQLCAGLLEPAARVLGDLWQSDDCNELEVSLGLGVLQLALRRVSADTPAFDVPNLPPSLPRAVLVAPSPHEPHLLGSSIASELFWRAGWDVRCEFPNSDEALGRLVHDRWFDVLDLSLSGAFRREHRLAAMAASIRVAQTHSCNPALTVIVDGRVFHDRPRAYAEVDALAGSASALGLVASAGPDQFTDQPNRAALCTRQA